MISPKALPPTSTVTRKTLGTSVSICIHTLMLNNVKYVLYIYAVYYIRGSDNFVEGNVCIVIVTKSSRVTDEVIVHLSCVGSNKDIWTNFAIKLLQNLNKLRVEQCCRTLQLLRAFTVSASHCQFCRNTAQWTRSCHQDPSCSSIIQALQLIWEIYWNIYKIYKINFIYKRLFIS